MRIDIDVDAAGNVHFVETHIPAVITAMVAIHKGLTPLGPSGWGEITKHPLYPGKTRLDAFRGEVIRLNDVAARAVLGI